MSNANNLTARTQLQPAGPKLTNLRDVLKAAHKNKIMLDNDCCYYEEDDHYSNESKRSSQLSLIDNILKLADSDLTSKLDNNNNNRFIANKKILQPAKKFDRKNDLLITRETEAEKIKIINRQLMNDKKTISSRENKNNTNNNNNTNKINSMQLNNHTERTKIDNSLNSLVFNNKATNETEETETESSISSSSCSSSSSIICTTTTTINNINNNTEISNNNKQDQSFIDYSSIMRQSVDIESYNSKLPLSSSSSSSYWNYDELNDLRIKFISLLSSDLTSETTTPTTNSSNQETTKFPLPPSISPTSSSSLSSSSSCTEETSRPLTSTSISTTPATTPTSSSTTTTTTTRLSSMSFLPTELLPISSEEQLKIESFYRSFGTSLYISSTAACLYTMTNMKVDALNSKLMSPLLEPPSMNRASIALSTGNTSTIVKNLNKPTHHTNNLSEINHCILKDFMLNKYQNHVNVYHRGIPLWLWNSGKNPRRPNQQLKFTLAEKGTGFILWQDRIDANSDYRIYALRKNDKKIINFNAYCSAKLNDDLNLLKENKFSKVNDIFSAMLITFRASDRKTTVFVKFDLNNEAASFYDYYLNINQMKQNELKQRTKSLPAGVGIQIVNKGFGTSGTSGISSAVTKRMTIKMNEHKRQQYLKNRQSYYNMNNNNNNNNLIKYKRIFKNEISKPCDLKHIININHSDRDSFYTLSKLLPATVYSSISNSVSYTSSSTNTSNDLSCLSSSSNSNSSTSISSNNNNNNETSNEPKRHSISNCKSKSEQIEQLSSLSSVSLSLSPPFKLIGNQLIDNNNSKNKIRNF